jgi:glutamate carboxypeptidase
MDSFLTHAQTNQKKIIGLIKRMVECESPTGDTAALTRMADLMVEEVNDIAKVKRLRGGQLLMDFQLPGRRKSGRILGLGHIDTVWDIGTLKTMPFRQKDGRLWGPGVLDMKSGVAFFICAMRALRDLEVPVAKRVSMLLVTDEEVGSAVSRPFTEREALKSDAVLVPEPGQGIEGKLKTARKGVGDYRVKVFGKAVHAGIDFPSGASAIVEMARQIEKIASFTDLKKGLTLNPGVVRGGSRNNVVADECTLDIDLRISRVRDAAGIDRKMNGLKPVDKRCRIEVTGGLNRPPMERTRGVVKLYNTAKRLAADLGLEIDEAMTGGGSDGNITAGLGIPTLDGLGGVGEGAHARNESILIDRIADRTALLAKLVAAL